MNRVFSGFFRPADTDKAVYRTFIHQKQLALVVVVSNFRFFLLSMCKAHVKTGKGNVPAG